MRTFTASLRTVVLLLAATSLLFAQGASEEARLRVLNGQAISLLARFQRGDAAAKSQARSEAVSLLQQRKAALDSLIDANPKTALLLAFPGDALSELATAFPASAAQLEARGQWTGKLEYIIQDGLTPASNKEIFRLHQGGGRRPATLINAGATKGDFQCNDTVAAAGVQSGDRIVASSTMVTEAANAVCSTTGPQKIAVIVVNMPGFPVADPTETEIRGIFLGNAASGETQSPDRNVNDFWSKNSDGKTWVNTTAPGAFTIVNVTLAENMAYCTCGTNGCSDNSGAMRQAAYAAADPLINFAEYSRIAFVVPHNNTCSGIAGVASIGCWGSEAPGDGQSNISWTWLRADQTSNRNNGVQLVTHEMGHNQTMSHSGSRDHGTEVIGPIGTAGARSEYGDSFGTMGSWNFGPYNAPHLVNRAGWMNSANFLDVTSTGVYSIPAFDTPGNVVKALRVKRGTLATNAWFWISYYPSTGWYLAPLGDQIHTGAIIHAQDSATPSGKTDLLDFTPASASNHGDPALAVGQCWQDPYTDLQICATSITNGMLNVTVNYSLPPCTNANPTLTFDAADLAKSTPAGTGTTFRVSVLNNDSTTCASRTFNMSSTLPADAGWTTSFSTNPTLAPGASVVVTMTKTPSASVPVGTYSINAIASSNFNSGSAGTSTGTTDPLASLTVSDPPAVAPAAPSSVTVTVAQTGSGKTKIFQSYTVRWLDNSTNEQFFDLTRCIVSGRGGSATCLPDGWGASVSANTTSYFTIEKPPAGTYRFSVRARNTTGSSAASTSANVTIP